MSFAIGSILSRPSRATSRRLAGWSTTRLRTVSAVVLVLVVLAATGLGIALYQKHSDSVKAQASRDALAAAGAIVPTLLTYKPDGIDAAFASKYSSLTGTFATDFKNLSEKTIIPAAKQRKITTSAKVAAAALTDSTTTTATALMFINQSTSSTDSPEPTLDGSRIRVSLTKVGDAWKVSGLVASTPPARTVAQCSPAWGCGVRHTPKGIHRCPQMRLPASHRL